MEYPDLDSARYELDTDRAITLTGAENMLGGLHSDQLSGGNASDTLTGRSGDDRLTGGAGSD